MPTVPYVKQTWTDGVSALSAARLAVIENGIYEISLAPAARVFHNANQSINDTTATALAFNSERFDTAAGASNTQHDTVTNNSRLTCRYAGKYMVSAAVRWGNNSTGTRRIFLRLNGATLIASDICPASNEIDQTITTLYDLAVNDYVEVVVFQNSGGALNVEVQSNFSPEFMMVRVA